MGRIIEHVKQPSDKTCTSACIAMLLGVPVDKVVASFHEDFMKGRTNSVQFLNANGLVTAMEYSVCMRFVHGMVYLVCVPSLNKVATLHNIVVDYRDTFLVYDPNMGVDGSKFYTYGGESEPGGVELKGYVIDGKITKESFDSYRPGR